MFSPQAMRNIIRIALQPITATKHPLYSPEAEEILMMISAHESTLGKNLKQIGGGPGRGVCQVEVPTMDDNWQHFLSGRRELAQQIGEVSGCGYPSVDHLTYNPLYNILMARLWLYRRPGRLPAAHDVVGMAAYAKAEYNITGAATEEQYMQDYLRVVLV
jgi:hypothetical protein